MRWSFWHRRFSPYWQQFLRYPLPYRVLLMGSLITSIGMSMFWPFMTVYMRSEFNISIGAVGLILSLQSLVGIASTSLAGMGVDKLGRKGALLLSLGGNSLVFLAMAFTHQLALWIVLLLLWGLFDPLYRVGSQALVADLVPPAQRANAYGLLRIIHNIGVSIGPGIGGALLVISYTPVFIIAALTLALFVLLTGRFVPETLQTVALSESKSETSPRHDYGYGRALRDSRFMAFCTALSLTTMGYLMVMQLLAVYMKDEFGLDEHYFGWMMMSNAVMVVTIELWIIRKTSPYRPEQVLVWGALTAALATLLISVARTFEVFFAAMLVLTLAEILIVPTAMNYAANLAPADMRGRYSSFYGLTWSLGAAFGPLLGSQLSQQIAPVVTWYGATVLSVLAAGGFAWSLWHYPHLQPALAQGQPKEDVVVIEGPMLVATAGAD
jgi:MFS family permease